MAWTPIFVPLLSGLDLAKESTLGEAELHQALNVDFAVDGRLQGRPSRGSAASFLQRASSTPWATSPSYEAAGNLATTGRTPQGLVGVRDISGERPALTTQGRLFVNQDDVWVDKGHFACTKVDRLLDFPYHVVIDDPATSRETISPDFSRIRASAGISVWGLLSDDGAIEREATTAANAYSYAGNATRCSTTTAAVVVSNANKLNFVYRTAGSSSLTVVEVASDARNPTDVGDAPCICPAAAGDGFYILYRTTTTDQYKAVKVSLVGVVTEGPLTGTVSGLSGIWIDNSVAGAPVLLGLTHTTGLSIVRRDTDLVSSAGTTITDGTGVGADVVVGAESSTQVWFAYRHDEAGDNEGDIRVGYANLTDGTATLLEEFRGYDGTSGQTAASVRWGICHQPLRVNGRMYLTLAAAPAWGYAATWLTVDLTNWFTTAANATGPHPKPTLVARGPTAGTYPHQQPSCAVPISDGSGFTFPTLDWKRFGLDAEQNLTGISASNGLNKVTFSRPRAAQVGDTTVFSGSIPHMVARGDCVELGFPFLGGTPGCSVSGIAGGSVADGSYGVVVCWRWTDEAGQVHRSAPSPIRTVEVSSPSSTAFRVLATHPQLTEKASRVAIEVYTTAPNATSDGLHYLQAVSTVFADRPCTEIDITTAPIATSDVIYTTGTAGEELANYPIPGDGGVVALGRRLWMADANRVYASKLWTPGYGPQFNDDAFSDQPTLYVNLPAGAGRVIALEAMDDKIVVFCARGVYVIQDGGPDNVGAGADFAPPLRVSNLRITGPRGSCLTDHGVLFCSPPDATDPTRGGPWLIDRQFAFTSRQYLGRHVSDFFATADWEPDLAYSPERQQAYITTATANGSNQGVVVLDFRSEKWAVWDLDDAGANDLESIAVVGGTLWTQQGDVAPYSGTPGTDTTLGDYAMTIKTSHLSADGRDGLGWSRIRTMTPLSPPSSGAHTLTATALLDHSRTLTSGAVTVAAVTTDTTWPTTRQAHEWRLPSQKCSQIQLTLSATPATAQWSAIRLDVAPLPRKGPPRNRS